MAVIHETIADLKRLRDETRLQIHLGTREAHDRWQLVEDKLARAAADAQGFAESTGQVLQDVTAELRRIRDAFRRGDMDEPTRRA